MANATEALKANVRAVEAEFWEEITYNTVTINARVQKDTIVEIQDVIYQAEVLLTINILDLPSPPEAGDAVTIGAASYRVGEFVSERSTIYKVICNKIG